MEVKVSVITPVYNTEKYLGKCLDSILEQTYKNFEVICVDDGSKDDSADILREYANRDERFKVIVQTNSGVGAARNRAIRRALGEYILFVDSDDYIEPTTLEKLVGNMSEYNADICLFNAEDFDAATGKSIYHNYLSSRLIRDKKVFDPKDFKENIFMISSNITWNKIYRRSFLIDNELMFMEDVRYEDTYFIYAVMLYAQRVTWIDERLYHYRKFRSDSQMNSDQDDYTGFIEAYEKAIDMMNKRSLLQDEVIRSCFYRKAAMILVYLFSNLNNRGSYDRFYIALKSGMKKMGIEDAFKKGNYDGNKFERLAKVFFESSSVDEFLFYERSMAYRDCLEQSQSAYRLKAEKETLERELARCRRQLKASEEKYNRVSIENDKLKREYSKLKNSRTVKAALKMRKIFTLNGKMRFSKKNTE